MKEWIGYYENILPDDVSNGIMNIKDGWEISTYSNHGGSIGIEKSKERVITVSYTHLTLPTNREV